MRSASESYIAMWRSCMILEPSLSDPHVLLLRATIRQRAP